VAEYLLPLVKIGGAALAMKGENAFQEAHQAQNAIQILGGHLRQLIPVELPKVAEDHYLVVMDKISATPDQYPRRVGKAVKKPL
jgi:16S rRNA (guanine527-N7)-methyltransferase